MAELTGKKRSRLADSSYAYVHDDERKLPINDAAHVRAALSRFNQTEFHSAAAKATAKRKIMAAAKKFGVDATPPTVRGKK
jgi:hypothetical protein